MNSMTSAHITCLECLLVTFASKSLCFCEYSSNKWKNTFQTWTVLWLRKKTGAQTEKKYCFLCYGMVNHMLPISKQCNVITPKCGCFLLWLTLWTPYLHHKCAIFLAKKKPCKALSSWRNLLLLFLWHFRTKVHGHHHWLLINSAIFSQP